MEDQGFDQLSVSSTTDESFVRIEPFSSSTNLAGKRSSKRHANKATFSMHRPCSSPTFDEHTRLVDRTKKNRLVGKYGSVKVTARNVPQKAKLYFADIFTTMIDLHWPGVILIFCASYVMSWVVFGLLWWLIAAIRGPSVCITGVIGKY